MMLNTTVSRCAVGRDLVVAQNTILLGAEPLDGATALMVEEMRAKFDRNAVQLFERMLQQ